MKGKKTKTLTPRLKSQREHEPQGTRNLSSPRRRVRTGERRNVRGRRSSRRCTAAAETRRLPFRRRCKKSGRRQTSASRSDRDIWKAVTVVIIVVSMTTVMTMTVMVLMMMVSMIKRPGIVSYVFGLQKANVDGGCTRDDLQVLKHRHCHHHHHNIK